jgi:sigma-B regulation protein RsbU (phosphoserine phosphatase)
MPRRLILLLMLVAALAGSPGLRASALTSQRPLDATALGERVDLTKDWLFLPGDSPAYASPEFDDRSWKAISTSAELSSYGFKFTPFCWYRVHARVRPDERHVVVGLQNTVGAYEVFANGVRLGGMGDMHAHALKIQEPLIAYPIPDQALAAGHGELLLAIRFSNQVSRFHARSLDDPLGPTSGVYLQSQDSAGRDISLRNSRIVVIELLQAIVELLIGLVSLALFAALRSQREYLAIAINLLAAALGAGLNIWRSLEVGSIAFFVAIAFLNAVGSVAALEFARLILRLPRTRLWLAIEVLVAAGSLSNPLALNGAWPIWMTFVAVFAAILIMDFLLPGLLFRGGWQGNVDARVLLPAILLGSVSDYYSFLLSAIFFFHLSRTQHTAWGLRIGSYRLEVNDLGGFAFDITILLFIVLRTIRIARERAESAAEVEAAHTTQQLLLARASQPTPGFSVESVYYPAGEVGGDFFLVSPGPDGSLIAIVGDVSGKGLLAAMRVSMILGVLRREDSRQPAAILNQLNEALLTQGEMGFTTACCVRLEHTGGYTIANAGHISPYSNGVEIATPPGLPLGLASHSEYETVSGAIHAGEKLVLMSDGVVEARSAKGELYGFDRLPGLTRMAAADIADIAQRFGQEDDITVLTIACCV